MELICYKDDDDEVFIGRDLAHAHNYSEGVASAIDAEVKSIIDHAYEEAKRIINENRDVLDRCEHFFWKKRRSQGKNLKHYLTKIHCCNCTAVKDGRYLYRKLCRI